MSGNKNTEQATTVYYRNNPRLRDWGVTFHWWRAEYTSMHNHDYYEFFIISSGKTNHTLNGKTRELSAGTLAFIRPEDCHQFTPVDGCFCIHINLAATEDKLAQLCHPIGADITRLHNSPRSLVQLSPRELSHFETCAGELNRLLSAEGDNRLAAMLTCHLLIYAIVLLSVSQNSDDKAPPEWLRLLLQRIHSPENLSCRAADIYRMAGYSPPVVIRAFKKYTGQTVTDYLTQHKMETARQMLLSTRQSVLDIAGGLGYNSVSHFNKVFRNSTGMSPTAYRSQGAFPADQHCRTAGGEEKKP